MVATVLCALLAWKVQKVERQKNAVAAIERTGGSVSYDWEVRDHPQAPGKTLLRNLLGDDFFDDVVAVEFTTVFDLPEEADAAPHRTVPMQLRDLTDLRELNLFDETIEDLELLEGLTRMETLWLDCESVRDLSSLEGMRNLRRLSLDRTPRLYDLSPLASLGKLEYLFLTYTPTRDVSPLMKLKRLKKLVLFTPYVEGKQIEELRLALPYCEVIYGHFTSAEPPTRKFPEWGGGFRHCLEFGGFWIAANARPDVDAHSELTCQAGGGILGTVDDVGSGAADTGPLAGRQQTKD